MAAYILLASAKTPELPNWAKLLRKTDVCQQSHNLVRGALFHELLWGAIPKINLRLCLVHHVSQSAVA